MIEVIGIPGSGKSTLIKRLSKFDNKFDDSRLYFPIMEKVPINKVTAFFRVFKNLQLILFCLQYQDFFCTDEHKRSYLKVIKRCFKILTIIIICRERNLSSKNTSVQEGVLHLMHKIPIDTNLFFKNLLSVYGISKISIIFLKVDLIKSLNNHSIRENVNFKDKEIKKYSNSLKVLEKLYDFLANKENVTQFNYLNKAFCLFNNEELSVEGIYKDLKEISEV